MIVGTVDAGRFGLNSRRRAQVFDLPSSTPNRPLGCHPRRGEDELAEIARAGYAEVASTDRKAREAAVTLFLSDAAWGPIQ